MAGKTILETDRLCLREFTKADAEFVIELLNSPGWLQNIGDRNVRSHSEAVNYLENSLVKNYKTQGFGFWLVQLKKEEVPIGMCGLIKRDTLDHVDIGFALLPDYAGKGYAHEAAKATMDHARRKLKLGTILGITISSNIPSIKLLSKIGLRFQKTVQHASGDMVLVFSSDPKAKDREEIDQLTKRFFSTFDNTNGKSPDLDILRHLFVTEGRIINNTSGQPEYFSLEEFIQSRAEIFANGSLAEFSERELQHETELYGNVAHRISLYEKEGIRLGEAFDGRGIKTIQFLKCGGTWKMSSLAWSDEI